MSSVQFSRGPSSHSENRLYPALESKHAPLSAQERESCMQQVQLLKKQFNLDTSTLTNQEFIEAIYPGDLAEIVSKKWLKDLISKSHGQDPSDLDHALIILYLLQHGKLNALYRGFVRDYGVLKQQGLETLGPVMISAGYAAPRLRD